MRSDEIKDGLRANVRAFCEESLNAGSVANGQWKVGSARLNR